MRIILLGPPGSGKGTQTKFLANEYKLKKISVGDIIRKKIQNKKNTNKQKSGLLLKDKIIFDLIKQDINLNNFILDGFPRTLKQAELIYYNKIKIDHIININIKIKNILKRLKYRLTEIKSGNIYNLLYYKPKIKNKDNITGYKLTTRNDDTYKSIIKRIYIFKKYNKNIMKYFKKKLNQNIFEINGNNTKKYIYTCIKKNITKYEQIYKKNNT